MPKQITAEVVEAAAKELQWPPYAERLDKRRLKTTPGPVEGVVRGILREQSRTLAGITDQLSKLEERSPELESIRKSQAAIEMHLRDLVQGRGVEPRPESATNRRQSTG